MPENDEQDVSAGAAAPVETDRDRFERERLSRRQALKRFGMTSAMATFALFSVDDLARMVGKAMQQRAGDNKVAAQVAKEFQSAGIVLANSPSGSPSSPKLPCDTTGCAGCSGTAARAGCCHKRTGLLTQYSCCSHAAQGDYFACQSCCVSLTRLNGGGGGDFTQCTRGCPPPPPTPSSVTA